MGARGDRPIIVGNSSLFKSEAMNWVQQQPGTLILEGTIMSIVYRSSSGGDFQVYQGERHRWPCMTLACAKLEAERIHQQLVEIGVQ